MPVDMRIAIFEGRIGKPVTEREKHAAMDVIPAVSHIDPLRVFHIQYRHAVDRGIPGNTWILGLRLDGIVGIGDGDGERQTAGRIHVAGEDIGQGVAGLGAQVPVLENGGDLLDPRHRDSIAGDVDDNQPLRHRSEGLDHVVLAVREAVLDAVQSFRILMVGLVQTADKNHVISTFRRLNSICDKLFRTAGLPQVLTGGNTVVLTAGIPHIAALPDDLGLGPTGLDAVQRRDLQFRFQRRGAATHGHHLDGILAYDQDFAGLPDYRQESPLVLEQDDGLGADFAGRRIVFRRCLAAEGTVAVHAGPENQAQDPLHAGIQFFGTDFTLPDGFLIRIGQIVTVVGIGLSHGKAIGPGTVFQVHAMLGGLEGVVHAAPVADHHAVKAPFPAEDLVQQDLVGAQVLVVIEVVGSHHGPGVALLDRRLEGRQIDLIQGTVVHDGVRDMAVHLAVVQGEMFHAHGNAVGLHALHVRNDHFPGKIRVLAHILEIASVQRETVDVHAGAQQDGLVPVAGLLADALAIQAGEFAVPGGSEAAQGRERRDGVIGPSGLVPLVPEDFGPDSVRTVGTPHFGDAQARDTRGTELGLGVDHRNFLVQRHAGESIVHPRLQRLGIVQIHGNVRGLLGRLPACDGGEGEAYEEKGSAIHYVQHCL